MQDGGVRSRPTGRDCPYMSVNKDWDRSSTPFPGSGQDKRAFLTRVEFCPRNHPKRDNLVDATSRCGEGESDRDQWPKGVSLLVMTTSAPTSRQELRLKCSETMEALSPLYPPCPVRLYPDSKLPVATIQRALGAAWSGSATQDLRSAER